MIPVATRGQTLGLGWAPDQKYLDLSQFSGRRSVQIGLPNKSVIQLSTNAVVRIIRDTGSSISAQNLRGQASVWEFATGQTAVLGLQPRSFTVANVAQGQVTTLHFVGAGDEVFKIRINNASVVSFEDAAKNKGRLIVEGLELRPIQRGTRWVVSAVERSAEITGENLSTWKAELPIGESATFGYSEPRSSVEVATGQSSTSDLMVMVQIHLPDGAKAVVGPNSTTKTGIFTDLSYYLAGNGAVTGSTADGKAFAFWPGQAAITGGPLREMTDGKGGKKIMRLTPVTEVTVRGTLGAGLEIAVGEQSIRVEPGRAPRVSLANGTELELFHDLGTQTLSFNVIKRYISASIPEIPGWKPLGLSGQEFGLQWNAKLKTADILNKSPDLSMLVLLPSRTVGTVAPGASFQFASLADSVYSTAAVGGRVSLVNTVTRKEISLTGENKVIERGRLSRGGLASASGAKEPIGLKWDYGVPLILEGVSQDPVMQPNSEKRMKVGLKNELSIAYSEQGAVLFTAVGGDFEISLGSLNGLKIEISEGDSVTLTLDTRKGTFIATTHDANSLPVKFTTPDGSTPTLPASNSLNFDLRKDGGLVAKSDDGSVLIGDFAGAGTDAGLDASNSSKRGTKGRNAGLTPSNDLDGSRIIETEVSSTGANTGR